MQRSYLPRNPTDRIQRLLSIGLGVPIHIVKFYYDTFRDDDTPPKTPAPVPALVVPLVTVLPPITPLIQ